MAYGFPETWLDAVAVVASVGCDREAGRRVAVDEARVARCQGGQCRSVDLRLIVCRDRELGGRHDQGKSAAGAAGEGRSLAVVGGGYFIGARGQRRRLEKCHAAGERCRAQSRGSLGERDRSGRRVDSQVPIADRGCKSHGLTVYRAILEVGDGRRRGRVRDRAGRVQGQIGHELVGHRGPQPRDLVVTQAGRVVSIAAAGDIVEIGRVDLIKVGQRLRRTIQRSSPQLIGNGDQTGPAWTGKAGAASGRPTPSHVDRHARAGGRIKGHVGGLAVT